MPEQGYYGTEDSPYANLYGERIVFTSHTSDPSGVSQGDWWLRVDMDSGDRLATMRWYNDDGIQDIPVFPEAYSVTNGVVKVGPIQTPSGEGFVPFENTHARFSELARQHGGVTYGLHDSNYGIPESEADSKIVHRWILNDINGTVEDAVGNDDGAVNGVTSVDGAWAGGRAGDGDGSSDYISTGTWGSFGSNTTGEFAIAFSFSTTTTNTISRFMGTSMSDNQVFSVALQDRTDNGQMEIRLRDADNDDINAYTNNTFNDGGQYRIVAQKTGSGSASFEFWINQSQEAMTVVNDQDYNNVSDFPVGIPLFARNVEGGGVDSNINATMNDVCVFNDSLTQTEIQSYTNPWS